MNNSDDSAKFPTNNLYKMSKCAFQGETIFDFSNFTQPKKEFKLKEML